MMLGADFINDLIMLRKFLSILNLLSALLIMKVLDFVRYLFCTNCDDRVNSFLPSVDVLGWFLCVRLVIPASQE